MAIPSIPLTWIEAYADKLGVADYEVIAQMLVMYEAEQALAEARIAEAVKTRTRVIPNVLIARRPFADAIAKMRDKRKTKASPPRKPLEDLL